MSKRIGVNWYSTKENVMKEETKEREREVVMTVPLCEAARVPALRPSSREPDAKSGELSPQYAEYTAVGITRYREERRCTESGCELTTFSFLFSSMRYCR
jgi:hypothetical protein